MGVYEKPTKRLHRGFIYLDDDVAINSLSAIESGKVDEIVSKMNSAREGGMSGGLTATVAGFGPSLEGARKSASAYEEEIVRTRTRFSIFETWLSVMNEKKALGRFNGWGAAVMDEVSPGDTVEVQARLDIVPIQSVLRTYLRWAELAKEQGTFWSQKGEELKALKESERNVRAILGGGEADEFVLLGTPSGDPGPRIAMSVQDRWLVGDLGNLGGDYTVVAQVDQLIAPGEELLMMRMLKGIPPTQVEMTAMKEAVSAFKEAAQNLGVTVSEKDAALEGPALWARPIAIYR